MPEFPRREANILELAEDVSIGLKTSPDVFPEPPLGDDQLEPLIADYFETKNAINTAEAGLRAELKRKDKALRTLVLGLKRDLRYAELVTKDSSDKLKLLGWNKRKQRRPLPVPDPPIDLTVVYQSEPGAVRLVWKKPPSGSRKTIRQYVVERRDQQADGTMGSWKLVEAAPYPEIDLTAQPSGLRLEYRVLAQNFSGLSNPSNTTVAVL